MEPIRAVVLRIAPLVLTSCSTADRPVETPYGERLADSAGQLFIIPEPVSQGSWDLENVDTPDAATNTQTSNVHIPAGFHRR
jgi:hypothetical protein